MPDFIRVDEESLMALPLAERLFPSSGVWVDYSFATELRIDQQTAGSGKRIHLFGALTTYAYWTDCLRVKGNAAFHFPVAVQLLEAGEFPADGAIIDDRGFATESNARKNGKRSKIKIQPEEREGYDRLFHFSVVFTGRDCRSGVQNTP